LLQIGGSLTMFVSSGLLIWAWYVETYRTQQFSDLSRNGIYLSLAGIGLHLLGGKVGTGSDNDWVLVS
jgi:Ni/Fe-hydrogenase subunit HybB-like protein